MTKMSKKQALTYASMLLEIIWSSGLIIPSLGGHFG